MFGKFRKTRFSKFGASALGAMLILPVASEVSGQGPVRNTARGVAQGAASITRGAAQATRNVAQGAAQVTRNTVQGAANVTRRAGQATVNTLDRTTDRITQPFNGRYSSNYRGNAYVQPSQSYQSNEGQWWYDGNVQHQSYATVGQPVKYQQAANNSPVYTLQHDANGREFICANGQRIYFDNQAATAQSSSSGSEVEETAINKAEQPSDESVAEGQQAPPAKAQTEEALANQQSKADADVDAESDLPADNSQSEQDDLEASVEADQNTDVEVGDSKSKVDSNLASTVDVK